MNKRFIKIGYGDGYAIKDSQVNGLPQIRLEYSDEACFLCDFLNKQDQRIQELKKVNTQFKEQVFNLIDKKLEENEKELNGVDTAMYYVTKDTLTEKK